MSQILHQPPAQPPKEPSKLLTFLQMLGKRILNNWPTKLLALVLAIGLWAGLITQDPTLTREKTFRNVSVSVNGKDTLMKQKRLVVTSDLDQLLKNVSFTAQVPQNKYSEAQASNYNIRADLSGITAAGEQEIRIRGTNSTTYGEVEEITPSAIRVTVEEYTEAGPIPVNVVMTGDAPEGYYVAEPSIVPSTLTVSGPASVVQRVQCAEIVLDRSAMEGREYRRIFSLPFRLLDVQGEEINSDMLQVTSNSVAQTRVSVAVNVWPLRSIPLLPSTGNGSTVIAAGLVSGKPAAGYEVVEIQIEPEIVQVAGQQSVVNTTVLKANPMLSINGRSDSVSGTVQLSIPGNLKWSSHQQAAVTVVIKPVKTERVFADVPVEIINLSDELTAEKAGSASVTVVGPQTWIQGLDAADLRVTCDVSGLSSGEYELPLACTIAGGEGMEYTVDVEPMTAIVTILPQE